MDSGEISIFVIVLGLMAIVVVFSIFNSRARQAGWREAASQAGLAYEPGSFWGKSPFISGVFHGRSLALDTFSTNTGKNRTTYTRLVVALENPAAISLSLSGEGLGSKMGKLVGMKEIQLGDAEFDSRFFVRGEPEMAVQRLLANSSLRQKLLDARSVNIEVHDRTIRYQKRGFESNPETLLSLFDLLSELSVNVERLNS
jgi:hypothetical protein